MKIRKLFFLTLAANMAVSAVNAEISGSGRPNAYCASGEISGHIRLQGPGQPGLEGVEVRLNGGNVSLELTAVTQADGTYGFIGLCVDAYQISILTASVPAGLTLTRQPDFDDGNGTIELHENDALRVDVDFGYSQSTPADGCALNLEAGCSAASLATELYQCNKPLNELSMRWNGSEDVRVVAHNGKAGGPVIAEFDNVSPGGVVIVSGMQTASKDVEWEVFNALTGTSMGLSRFHIACDDEQMNGPEDCLTPQGNGKDDKDERINDWLLYGLQDASGTVDCSEPVMAETCGFQASGADCSSVTTPSVLTMTYGSGDCDTSVHEQGGGLHCHDSIDPAEPVLVETGNEDPFLVQPGATFSILLDGSDADLRLSNSGGTRHVKFKADCSKPLATGDEFGGLQLVAINGQGDIAPVDFDYILSNSGDAVTVTVHESVNTLAETEIVLPAQSSLTLHGSAWLSGTSTNIVTVAVNGDEQCSAVDLVTAIKEPAPTCNVTEIHRELHDKELRWMLQAGNDKPATIKRIEVSWPAAAGTLKEANLGGDKFFDQEVAGPQLVIDESSLIGDLHKRRIPRIEPREMKLKFGEDIEGAPGDVGVTVYFEEGCSVSW